MFTGIVETLAKVENITTNDDNFDFTFQCELAREFKIGDSVAHNGVCLTVTSVLGEYYTVSAVAETLQKTNLKHLKVSDMVNLERSMLMGARLDGHLVQGHVDTTAICTKIERLNGSHLFGFEFGSTFPLAVVPKGSIAVNGVSLTLVEADEQSFNVAVIPYTFENTNFRFLQKNDMVNIEFDIIGKYVAAYLQRHYSS